MRLFAIESQRQAGRLVDDDAERMERSNDHGHAPDRQNHGQEALDALARRSHLRHVGAHHHKETVSVAVCRWCRMIRSLSFGAGTSARFWNTRSW